MDPVILADVPADRYIKMHKFNKITLEFRFEKTCYICAAEGNNEAANIGACMSCNKTGCKVRTGGGMNEEDESIDHTGG